MMLEDWIGRVGGRLIYPCHASERHGVYNPDQCADLEPLKLSTSCAASWSNCMEIEVGSDADAIVWKAFIVKDGLDIKDLNPRKKLRG
jgi:hypothetical protein